MDQNQTPDNPEPTPQPVAPPATQPAPPPPPPEHYYGPAPPQYPGQPKSSGLAVASLVLGIVGLMTAWFVVGGFLALVGLVLGIISLAKKMGGRGMAIAGIVTSSVALLIVAAFVALVAIVASEGIQQRAESSTNQAAASHIKMKAEAYNVIMAERDRSNYPDYQTLISQTEVVEAQLDDKDIDMLSDGSQYQASTNNPVTYQACPDGALISYWDQYNDYIGTYEAGQPDLCAFSLPTSESITQSLRYQS